METNVGEYIKNYLHLKSLKFPRNSLHCKLVPVQYWEYKYGPLYNISNVPWEQNFLPERGTWSYRNLSDRRAYEVGPQTRRNLRIGLTNISDLRKIRFGQSQACTHKAAQTKDLAHDSAKNVWNLKVNKFPLLWNIFSVSRRDYCGLSRGVLKSKAKQA